MRDGKDVEEEELNEGRDLKSQTNSDGEKFSMFQTNFKGLILPKHRRTAALTMEGQKVFNPYRRQNVESINLFFIQDRSIKRFAPCGLKQSCAWAVAKR